MTQTFRQSVCIVSAYSFSAVVSNGIANEDTENEKEIAATPATVLLYWSRIHAIVGEEKRADPTVVACAKIDRHGRNDQQ